MNIRGSSGINKIWTKISFQIEVLEYGKMKMAGMIDEVNIAPKIEMTIDLFINFVTILYFWQKLSNCFLFSRKPVAELDNSLNTVKVEPFLNITNEVNENKIAIKTVKSRIFRVKPRMVRW